MQRERMKSAANAWEAHPWNASDAVANLQFKGFEVRAQKPIEWTSIRPSDAVASPIFGIERKKLIGADVAYCATCDGEEMLLSQLSWHGFPDPPEWGLATRLAGQFDQEWHSWGYFADLPPAWNIPKATDAQN